MERIWEGGAAFNRAESPLEGGRRSFYPDVPWRPASEKEELAPPPLPVTADGRPWQGGGQQKPKWSTVGAGEVPPRA